MSVRTGTAGVPCNPISLRTHLYVLMCTPYARPVGISLLLCCSVVQQCCVCQCKTLGEKLLPGVIKNGFVLVGQLRRERESKS